MAGGSQYNSDTAAAPSAKTGSGYTPQQAGIANINGAFGGDASAAAMSQAIQKLYTTYPSITPAQVSKIVSANAATANAKYNPDTTADKIFGDLALAGSMAGIGILTGGVLAPALAAGAGVTGAAAGGAGVAGSVGTGLGAIGASAAAGGVGGALDSALQGQSIGKGALLGAAGAGLGAAAKPIASSLTSAGLPAPAASALVKGGIGAVTNGLNGGSPVVGALAGGISGAASGANTSLGGNALTGAVAGLGASQLTSAVAPMVSGNSLTAAPQQGTSQGNIGNMAITNNLSGAGSTDSTLASAITGALPSVLQGAAGVYGAQNAAQAQTTADNSAINTQQNTMGNIQNVWNTQQGVGQGADTALSSSLGLGGAPANPSNFLNMPGYQFAVQQGTQAIQRQAASLGNAYTPNTAAAVGQYVTGTASQDYNTYISQLMGAAGLGTTANQGLQTGQQTTGSNISQLQQNIGQAQASGVTGASNAVGGVLGGAAGSSLIGAASNFLGGGANTSGITSGTDPGTFGGTAPVSAQNTVGSGYNTTGAGTAGNGDYGFGTPDTSTDYSGVDSSMFGGGDSSSDLTSFLGDGF
jgi:hypothetical protein